MFANLSKPAFWFKLPAYTLFFLMLFVPTTYQPIKAVLLLPVVGLILFEMFWNRRIKLHSTVVLWTLVMTLTGIAFVLYGLIRGAPGALRVSTVYVMWPILYTLFVAASAKIEIISTLFKMMVGATIIISLYSMTYILNAAGWLPSFLYIEVDQAQRIGFYSGWVQFHMQSMTTLLFMVPFLFAALLAWPKDKQPPVSRVWLWVGFILGLAIVLLSGRRALWLVVAAAPFITLIFRQLLPGALRLATRKVARRVMLGIAATVLCLYGYLQFVYGFDIASVITHISEGFEFSSTTNESPMVRQQQFFALVDDWAESPLVGMGLGAVSSGNIRNEEQPWVYELTYLALLFHTGIVGFAIYLSGILWIYWTGLQMIRSGHKLGQYILPVFVGMTCFLIANGTNPYLETYDYIWVIFLPVALINLCLLTPGCPEKEPLQPAETATIAT